MHSERTSVSLCHNWRKNASRPYRGIRRLGGHKRSTGFDHTHRNSQGLYSSLFIAAIINNCESRGIIAEVSAKKICGEEETWSDQSLPIFKENWNGIISQYRPFATAVQASDPRVDDAVERAYEAAMAVVEPYFRPNRTAAEPYSSVGISERRAIVRASYRLRNALGNAMEVLRLA
ncbi:MAG: hypothetical protein GDA56_01380 [Hormoscilla sp. GM7CHS1pb]|nr:hypothetical protein [Hormoscilla sp. GM7CHS1pb]